MNNVGVVSVSTVVLVQVGKWNVYWAQKGIPAQKGILGSKVWCTVCNAFSPNCRYAWLLIFALDSDILFLNLSLACWSLSEGWCLGFANCC